MIVLQIDPVWAERIAHGAVEQAQVQLLSVCAAIDPLIVGLIAELQRLGPDSSQTVMLHMVALGHCLAARLLQMFTRIASAESPMPRRQLGQERLARVVDFVERHYNERITLDMLAREARLSPGHFGVLFKATTGQTPEQYVLRVRLLRAKPLIEAGNHSVSEVAYMTGFSDHSHFTSQFKRLFGAPPRSFLPLLRHV